MTHISGLENSLNYIKIRLNERKQKIYVCFLATFLLGLLAHAYGFMHSSFAHDALNAFIATSAEKEWKIMLGRFFVPAYMGFIRGAVTLPWLVGVLGLTYSAVAVFLVTEIFDIRSKCMIWLTAGIMVTNITYTAQIATYMHEFDCNVFAMMLSVVTVYLWSEHKGIISYLSACVCLMIALGIYQAYLDVTVSLIILKSVMDLFDDTDIKDVFIKGIRGIVIILSGGILYWLSGKVIYAVTGIGLVNRTNVFAFNGENPVALYLGLIKPSMKHIINSIMHPAYTNILFSALVVLLTVWLCVVAVVIFVKRKYSLDRVLLIIALVAVFPFGADLVYFLARGQSVHDLMIYALWFFYFFIMVFADKTAKEFSKTPLLSATLKTAVFMMLTMFIWQNIILANTSYLKRDIEAESTMSVMTRVVDKIESRDDYTPGQTELAFIGVPLNAYTPYGLDRTMSISGMWSDNAICMDTSISIYNNYKVYLNYIMQRPAAFCSDSVHAQLKIDQRVREMPAFPENGYIEMIDGVLVVKMG